MQDLLNRIKASRCISPDEGAASNTAKVGQIIDNQGFDSLTYLIATGTLADADATFTVLLEEGDDSGLSDAAAVADVDLISTEALAGFIFSDDDIVNQLGYVGSKRYTRLTITPAANTGAWDIAAIAVQGSPAVSPAG